MLCHCLSWVWNSKTKHVLDVWSLTAMLHFQFSLQERYTRDTSHSQVRSVNNDFLIILENSNTMLLFMTWRVV